MLLLICFDRRSEWWTYIRKTHHYFAYFVPHREENVSPEHTEEFDNEVLSSGFYKWLPSCRRKRGDRTLDLWLIRPIL